MAVVITVPFVRNCYGLSTTWCYVKSTEEKGSLNSDTFQELKKKSIAGMGALFVRQVLVKVIFFIGNIILARLLAPKIFGIYAIVNFVVTFFSTFGDVGIGAALIQKKGELTREELSSTFWLQQTLVWSVVGAVVVAAPLALKIYPTLPPVGVWLIRAMAASFLFSSLKTIPAILMERDIDFKRIAWVDIAENLGFQAVAITCAYLGFDAWSFVLAAITRGFLGAVIIYVLSPWRPSLKFRFESVKGLVRFGVPYQSNQILCFIKDAVTPLFVGAYAGAAAVGYLNWARNAAFAPLMISDSFSRVAFPALAKLQGERELMARTVERSIRILCLVMCPIAAIMAALGPEITRVVFTEKWMPGLPAYYLFCFTPYLMGVTLPMTSAILSMGHSRVMVMMTASLIAIEWGIGVPAILKLGFSGIAVTQPLSYVLFSGVYKYVLKKDGVNVALATNTWHQFLASLLSAVCLLWLKGRLQDSIAALLMLGLLGCLIYLAILTFLNRRLLLEFKDYIMHLKPGN